MLRRYFSNRILTVQSKIDIMNELSCFISLSVLFLCIDSCKEMTGTDFYIEKSFAINQNCEFRAVLPTFHDSIYKKFQPRGVVVFDLFGTCDTIGEIQYLQGFEKILKTESILVDQLKHGGEISFTYSTKYGNDFLEKLKKVININAGDKIDSIITKEIIKFQEKQEVDLVFQLK